MFTLLPSSGHPHLSHCLSSLCPRVFSSLLVLFSLPLFLSFFPTSRSLYSTSLSSCSTVPFRLPPSRLFGLYIQYLFRRSRPRHAVLMHVIAANLIKPADWCHSRKSLPSLSVTLVSPDLFRTRNSSPFFSSSPSFLSLSFSRPPLILGSSIVHRYFNSPLWDDRQHLRNVRLKKYNLIFSKIFWILQDFSRRFF